MDSLLPRAAVSCRDVWISGSTGRMHFTERMKEKMLTGS
jgi:hypothetical protein